VRVHRNVLIPMSDGVQLAADLYAPADVSLQDDSAPLPVVLEYIPYRKDDMVPGSRYYDRLVEHRYIVARVDVRGTGSSGGVNTDEYVAQEQADGHETVEWLAAQPWCDGHVNMMGFSYGGFTALQVAATRPPHLTSIIPGYFTDDRYTDDCHYAGGLMRMYYDVLYYGTFMIAYNALPPAAESFGDDWPGVWDEHVRRNEPYMLQWLRHQVDGPYWRQGSVRDALGDIRCPVLMLAGWQDGYPNPPLRLLEGLSVPHKLLVGPWNHAQPDMAVPGPRIDYLHEVVRWLDHWCRDRDTGIMDEPPIAAFVQEHHAPVADRLDSAGHWRSEVSWPPPGASERTLHLGAGRLAPEHDAPDEDALEYVPTVGTAGGLWSGGVPFGLAGDQREDEPHALLYTTGLLEEDVTILGRARVVVHVACSAPVIGFVARLCDVAPDGRVQLVTKGMLNATRRASLSNPEPLVPGEWYALELELDATAWRFRSGHRIRLSISNSDWPNVWPTPYAATSWLARGETTPSRLILPEVPREGSGPAPDFRPSSRTVSPHAAAPVPPTWRVSREPLTRASTVEIEWQSRERVDAWTVIEREYSLRATVREDDPARASARGRHTSRVLRGERCYSASSDVSIQAAERRFDVAIALDVALDGNLHGSRRWVEAIPRNLL
jgi:putative CocE/NonD family hydrolase